MKTVTDLLRSLEPMVAFVCLGPFNAGVALFWCHHLYLREKPRRSGRGGIAVSPASGPDSPEIGERS